MARFLPCDKKIDVGSELRSGRSPCKPQKALIQKKEQLEVLIDTVEKTIKSLKGEIEMKDYEKFEGFKQKLVDENEREYGKEVRSKYGNEAVDASNKKLMNMTKEQYEEVQRLSEEINATLAEAMKSGDPAGNWRRRHANSINSGFACSGRRTHTRKKRTKVLDGCTLKMSASKRITTA